MDRLSGHHLFLVVSISKAIDLGETVVHLSGDPGGILLRHHMIISNEDHIHLITLIINLLMVATLLTKWLQGATLVLVGSRGLIACRDLLRVEVMITTAGKGGSLTNI